MQKRKMNLSIVYVTAIYIALSFFLANFFSFSKIQNLSLFIAGILGVINIVASIVLLTFSYEKEFKEFMIIYFGGMGIRLLFFLLIIFFIIKFIRIDIFVFILSFFVLYFIFQAIEIYFIHSYQRRK